MKTQNRIAELSRKDPMRIAGMMSGTSADGIDVAIIDVGRAGVSVLAFYTFSYPAKVRRSVLRLCSCESGGTDEICHLNFVLGEVSAESLIKLCSRSGIDIKTVDLVGSHGQTVCHNPKGRRFGGRIVRSTLQLGESSVIAHRCGITTVADFRPRDMAANGQGAPLVPFADYVLFRDRRRARAVQNIGGIANVTYLPADCETKDIIAFDTGPGNMIMDRLISLTSGGRRNFDKGGRTAAKGTVDQGLLREMLRHPFLHRSPPKSTGHEEFGSRYCDKLYHKARRRNMPTEDIIATAAAFTAASIADAYGRFLPQAPDEVVLCGGGAHNGTLVAMLQERLEGTKILLSDELGVNCDAKEAVSFAILAHATIKGVANNVPSATGAEQPLVLGKIIPA